MHSRDTRAGAYKRPGGRPLSRNQVDGIQRVRLLSAMATVAAEHGFLGASVGRVVECAGVSRRTFYELFDSREDCFLAAFAWGVGQARELVLQAYAGESSWREGVRMGTAALLGFFDSERELARVCVVEALGAGPVVLEQRAGVLRELARAMEAGALRAGGAPGRGLRRGGAGAADTPLLGADGVVGGALSVVHTRLLEPGKAPLTELQGQLMALIVLPYLGPKAAGEELARPASKPAPRTAGSDRSGELIFKRLNMRLTYRTVRCLLFIAEHPGASNREVAEGAEIADEGQASKLLMRLAKLGLVSKQAQGPGRPNAWRIAPEGEGVLQVVENS